MNILMTKWLLTMLPSGLFSSSETNTQQDLFKRVYMHMWMLCLGLRSHCMCTCNLTHATLAVSVEYKRYNGTNQKRQAHRNNDDHCGICKQQSQAFICAGDHTVYCTTTANLKTVFRTVLISVDFLHTENTNSDPNLIIQHNLPSYPSHLRLNFCPRNSNIYF